MTSKEALKEILYNTKADENNFYFSKEAVNIINKLVERDTPKKPIKNKHDVFLCPICDEPEVSIYEFYDDKRHLLSYCNYCGQKIDWE